MPASFRLTVIAASLALAGCAGLAERKPLAPDASVTAVPELAPGASALVKPGLAIDRWWMLFGDAQLTRLMDEALARNEDLEAAVARVREARAALEVAGAARFPTLDLQGRNREWQDSTVGGRPLPPGAERRTRSHEVSLAAGYEIDLWDRIGSLTAAARHQLLAAQWARSAVEWGLTARLAEAYFGLAAVDRQMAISESVLASREATFGLRRKEHVAGAGNELELRRAEAEFTGTQATLASLLRQRIALERAVTVLLGRTPQEIVSGPLARAVLDESQPLDAVLPQGAAAELLSRRPDVRQAEAKLAAGNAGIDAARAATLPSVRLSGSIGSDARSIRDLFSGPAFIFSLAASVSQSLVDGGKLEARVAEETERTRQALADYRKAVAAAVLDVRETYAALDAAQQSLVSGRGRVAALERAREVARRGYDNGALSQLDVLDADRNWYQARLDLVTAYKDRLVGQVAAFKALGGGYVPAQAIAQR